MSFCLPRLHLGTDTVMDVAICTGGPTPVAPHHCERYSRIIPKSISAVKAHQERQKRPKKEKAAKVMQADRSRCGSSAR